MRHVHIGSLPPLALHILPHKLKVGAKASFGEEVKRVFIIFFKPGIYSAFENDQI